jgi:predicted transcriptional regulator
MKSYLEILQSKAEAWNVPLLKAFKSGDIPTSTYYRTINGQTELRHETARKVMKNLEKLYALQQARKHTEELRNSGERIDIRKTRAKFKPRSIGT